MSENTAPEEDRRKGSTEPGLEGEGGQYEEGDYGEAGVVGGAENQPEEGDYPEGDYGEAGSVDSAREVEVDEDKNP
ncbi:hypothetical protein [Pseudarthrobacter sp. NBSH8]|uniref:hypothetical protein n=1 Tax=Pseudarthrobacter sp. NBSH8 TaxID=2596911 RepID=UPI001626E501|nr:hypothetical protein [Pseudarthrobacter sp. NBSH8]QNE16028.1 hypothetical protein FYJ92_17505 [Pseudarthrobacter sp. NBSH8]